MKNAMSYALEIEEMDLSPLALNLGYSKDAFEAISEKCHEDFGLACRKVEPNDSLKEGEWLVAFFGFWATKFDYEGRPEVWDYTFARQENDGTWTERASIGAEVTTIDDIEKMISNFQKIGIEPLFIAVKAE